MFSATKVVVIFCCLLASSVSANSDNKKLIRRDQSESSKQAATPKEEGVGAAQAPQVSIKPHTLEVSSQAMLLGVSKQHTDTAGRVADALVQGKAGFLTEKVSRRQAAGNMQLFADTTMDKSLLEMFVGNMPPGMRTLVITRWNENATKIASVRNAFEALGIDVLMQPSPTTVNDNSEELAAAVVPDRHVENRGHGAMVALAHMLALQKASEFEEPWTLILEEDARPLPIAKDRWLAGFNAAWNRLLARDVAMVRLGWCEFEPSKPEVEAVGDGFQLVHRIHVKVHTVEEHTDEGVCTTGYIVNKKYISQVLKTFPVDWPVDVAWRNNLWNSAAFNSKVYSITHEDAVAMYNGWAKFDQHGLIAQDQRDFPRPASGSL